MWAQHALTSRAVLPGWSFRREEDAVSGLSVNLAERCKFLKNLLSRKSLDDFYDYGVLLDRSHAEHILCGRMDCMTRTVLLWNEIRGLDLLRYIKCKLWIYGFISFEGNTLPYQSFSKEFVFNAWVFLIADLELLTALWREQNQLLARRVQLL